MLNINSVLFVFTKMLLTLKWQPKPQFNSVYFSFRHCGLFCCWSSNNHFNRLQCYVRFLSVSVWERKEHYLWLWFSAGDGCGLSVPLQGGGSLGHVFLALKPFLQTAIFVFIFALHEIVLEENTLFASAQRKNTSLYWRWPALCPLINVFSFDLVSHMVFGDFFRYDPSTGIFTVPPGGDGLFYFSTYLLVDYSEWGRFNIRVNGEILCSALGDNNSNGDDYPQATCSSLTQLTEGLLCHKFIDLGETIPWPGLSTK